MLGIRKIAVLLFLALFLFSAGCNNDSGTDNNDNNTVTSRLISVRLRADQTVTFRARFALDGTTIVSQASSVVSGLDSVITFTVDALSLPRGRHTIRATILQEVPAPSTYKLSVSVTENDKPVGASGDVTASVPVNGSIELVFAF